VIKDYYELAKPGLVYGNVIPLIGGFAAGAQAAHAGSFSLIFPPLVAAIIGLAFVMGSGCVFNNYIDRDIDAKMERTKDRALAAQRISGASALLYGVALGIAGFAALFAWTNFLTAAVAGIGFFFYVVVYSLWFKRRTRYAVLVGAVAGAVPPVVGYVAMANRIDAGAWLLFAMLFIWQLPHFFAIAIRRADDYAAAGVPVVSIREGLRPMQVKMTILILLYIIVAVLFGLAGYAGFAYLAVVLLFGAVWLALGVQGFWVEDALAWSRGMFIMSLIVLTATFVTMALTAVI